MKSHIQYLWYVVRHRWFVLVECFRMGIPWRGITHDLSKFLPSEWFPYAQYFYGEKSENPRDGTGYYKPTDTGNQAFDFAWLLHQKRNRHHWQWWILPEDDGGTKVLKMGPYDIMEMVADWCGASRAQGHGGWAGVRIWYKENAQRMVLNNETRCIVDGLLGSWRK